MNYLSKKLIYQGLFWYQTLRIWRSIFENPATFVKRYARGYMSLSHVVMCSDLIKTRYPQDESDSADAASCIG